MLPAERKALGSGIQESGERVTLVPLPSPGKSVWEAGDTLVRYIDVVTDSNWRVN